MAWCRVDKRDMPMTERGLISVIGKAYGDAADFLGTTNGSMGDGLAVLTSVFRRSFFGAAWRSHDGRDCGIMRKASMTSEDVGDARRARQKARFNLVGARSFVLVVSKKTIPTIDQRCPSTLDQDFTMLRSADTRSRRRPCRPSGDVAAGSADPAVQRRFVGRIFGVSEIGPFAHRAQSCSLAPLVPSPAVGRLHDERGRWRVAAIFDGHWPAIGGQFCPMIGNTVVCRHAKHNSPCPGAAVALFSISPTP